MADLVLKRIKVPLFASRELIEIKRLGDGRSITIGRVRIDDFVCSPEILDALKNAGDGEVKVDMVLAERDQK